MTLSEVPVVLIDLLNCRKFIVAQLKDSDGAIKMVVRANRDLSHDGLCGDLAMELQGSGIHFNCLGGGVINVIPKDKEIKIGGKSTDYGPEPDRHQTAQMIQTVHPDFQVQAHDGDIPLGLQPRRDPQVELEMVRKMLQD